MPEGTVRGTFDLSTPATRKMRELRREAGRTDAQFRQLGATMDRVGGPTAERRISAYRREVRALGRDVDWASRTSERAWSRSTRTVTRSVATQTTAVRGLRREVRQLGRERPVVNIEIRGLSHALAQVELLHRRLAALGRQRATPRVGIGGGFAGGAAGAALGGGRGGGGSRPGAIGSFGLGFNPRAVLALSAVALPAIQALSAAVIALGGSLASAAAGFGAIGTAAGGAAAVGLGAVAAIAIPATKRISEAYKAQTKYAEASQDATAAGETQRAGMERVRQAHEQLTAAQRQSRYAQEALTEARKDARRELINMAFAADRSVLSERRARLEVRRAREEVRQTEADPQATGLQRDEARLGLQEAMLGRREARVERRRSGVDYRHAKRGGVAGMPQTVQARRQAAEATRGVREARRQVSEAAEEFARGSNKIATAKQELDKAFSRAPQGTRRLISDLKQLRRLWGAPDEGTPPGGADPHVKAAQQEWTGFLRGGVGTLKRMTPTLGRAGLRGTRAVRREGREFGKFLEGPSTKSFIGSASASFDENLTQVRRFTQYTTEALMNISRAARPFLLDATKFMATWSRGWATSTRDIGGTRKRIRELVEDFKAWKRLTGAVFRLMFSLFRAGRPSGRSMVSDLTAQLNRWDEWVKRNPRQVRAFFERSVKAAVELARALWQVVKALGQMSDTLLPILKHFSQLVGLAGNLGMLTPGALALGVGALRGARGARAGARGGGPTSQVGQLAPGMAAGAMGVGATTGAARGGRLRGALKGAGRAYAPLAGGLFALGALGFKGNFGERLQAGAATSLPFVPMPESREEATERRVKAQPAALQRFLGGHGGSDPRTLREQKVQIAAINVELLKRRRMFGGKREDQLSEEARNYNRLLRDQLGYLRDTIAQEKTRRREKDRVAGAKVAEEAPRAFGIYRRAGLSPERAMRRTNRGVLREMEKLGPTGARVTARNYIQWAREQARGNPLMLAHISRFERGVVRRFRRMGRAIRIINGNIYSGSRKEWGRIADALIGQSERARQEVTENFTRIQRKAINSLTTMGFSRSEAKKLVRGIEAGGGREAGARGTIAVGPTGTAGGGLESGSKERARDRGSAQAGRRATGGRLPGRGLRDTVALANGDRGAPGEIITNRHTERRVNRLLSVFGTTLGRETQREQRPHSAPIREREYAKGGRLGVSDLVRAGRALQAQGYNVAENRFFGGVRGTHARGGWHYKFNNAGAIDVNADAMPGGEGKALDRIAPWLRSQGISVIWRAPDHYDHLHADIRGAGGATGTGGALPGGLGMGMEPLQLGGPRSRLRGTPGALSTRAGKAYAKGLETKVNEAIGAMGGGGGDLSGFSGGGSSRANMMLGRRMMLAAGFAENQWPALRELWTRESNWNHLIANTAGSGAYGIPQSLPASKMASAGADWRTNPATQIKWGLGYIRQRYRTPQSALAFHDSNNWYSTGGRLGFGGWLRRGGSFETRRPTVFGAGEGQASGTRERVTVQKVKGGGATRPGPIHVTVNMGGVTVNGDRDIRKTGEQIAEIAGRKLLAALSDGISDDVLAGVN